MVGDYYNDAGRAGSIWFSLMPHDTAQCGGQGEHARGDVLMVPRGATRPLTSTFQEPGGEEPVTAQVLTIELIRVAGDQVNGTMTPYRDPETGVFLLTTFGGRIAGDRITGRWSPSTAGPANVCTDSGRLRGENRERN